MDLFYHKRSHSEQTFLENSPVNSSQKNKCIIL
jgi:hypothetical protein